jgi:hypothetical protein
MRNKYCSIGELGRSHTSTGRDIIETGVVIMGKAKSYDADIP